MITILLIDDDVLGITVRATVLRSVGYNVLLSKTGRDGLAQFEREHVDLVVLDFHLPDINGDVVLSHLRALKPHIPVILLAGILGLNESNGAIPDAMIIKGEGPHVLLDTIRRLTERDASV